MQSREGGIWWHVLQTYSAADVAFERYLRWLHPHKNTVIRYKNEVERRVELLGNRNIFFKSGHNFEDLRTETLDGVIIDEARQQRPELWPRVIYPMCARFKAWGEIMTTPNGFDWIYDLKNNIASDPTWTYIHAPSWESWWWTRDEIETAKRNMSELEFRQEIGAEFVNLRAGKVYYGFGDENKRETCPWYSFKPWSPYHPVILGSDFNVNPMHWTLGQTMNHNWWWFDEIHLQDSNTPEACDVLIQKVLLMRSQGFDPPDYDIIICGDQTAERRDTRGPGSDYSIIHRKLKAAGLRFRDMTPARNPPVRDRVNSVNAKCRSADGTVGMWIHPIQCKMTVYDLERVTWKIGADFILDPGPLKDLTHASDSIGYPIAEMSPIRDATPARLKIITRSLI